RDQAPDEEKCLVFGDLLTGSARNWYRLLNRTTRSTWKDLLRSFQVQYCGRGVSVARQYYHARKRSDESPLEYLYRLNVAGLRARLQIKDGTSEVRREHVEHFIETLDDRDLADHFALLRIPDADTLEEALRSRQRAKARQSKAVYGSIKPRQKNNTPGNNEGQQDQDQRNQDHSPSETGNNRAQQDRHDISSPPKRCSHCGSRKHSDLGCWGRLTCEKRTLAGLETGTRRASSVMMALEISPGESRGYWKYHVPDKKFKQSKAMGKVNNKNATLLFNSVAEVSILVTTFGRKVGCQIYESQTLECEGVGRSPYKIEGRTRLKVTLAGSLVYFFDAWVGPPTGGQDLILRMDFMVPAGFRLDLADGTICLHDWTRYLQVTDISDRALTLHERSRVAMWLRGDRIPQIPGYVSVGSRRYAEWQNLAYQATTDEISEEDIEPAVERPEYVTPTAILPRPAKAVQNVEIVGDGDASLPLSKRTSDQGKIDRVKSNDLHTKIEANIGDPTMEDEVCIKEGGSLFAEDVEDQMAVLPEVTATTEEVKIEDLQIGDTQINTQEEIERLVQIIWKRKHLLIGKGNALPPAAKGVVCDIDVGNAKPVAQRCRKVAIQFREKLYQLIQGLLSARMIRPSTSPWASPIVVIIKKNGIDIRLCIDYRLVNSLTRLMVYPMPLINDLLDDLDKVLWYCSLDMASGFWVVPMTDRARSISAFITPFGLFEWN
ncbi:Reverse transcriptase, partial [Phytophthora palmivora]